MAHPPAEPGADPSEAPRPPGHPLDEVAASPPGHPEPPRWPAWYAPVGFLAAAWLTLSFVVLLDVAGARAAVPGPALVIIQALAQDTILVGTALFLAARTARPRAWHFGLEGAPAGRALRWAGRTLMAYVAFLVVARVYEVVFHPRGDQRIVEALGVDRGLGWLVIGGVVVIVLAPVAEELFFRGFFYGSLRRSIGAPGAALASSVVFAVVHFTGSQTLSLLPLLAVLGLLFCLLYERTGSLYPGIALHALNNAVAYAGLGYMRSLEGGVAVGVGLGLAMLVASVVVPALAAARSTAPRAA